MGKRSLSRRRFLGSLGVAGTGVALTSLAVGFSDVAEDLEPGLIPFHGLNQAGISTPAQERLYLAAFDLKTEKLSELRSLLKDWTLAAERMCSGNPVGTPADHPLDPPIDTGEALGLNVAKLTITVGFGRSMFFQDGHDRFGLGRHVPDPLIDLPPFAGENLDPARSGGDLIVQACANDAQVAFHAIRNFARIARGIAVMRWSQLGFGRAASTSKEQTTPRNLMGFKDGTNNLKVEDTNLMAENVWVPEDDGPSWMAGGTYMVVRRIRMLIEVWDRSNLQDQEQTFGRCKVSGAPIGEHDEFDAIDFQARAADGAPLIPERAHVRLANPASNSGTRILRRGYSFADGIDPVTGQLDAGLCFICFQRDPRTQFVPIQQNLSTDLLNEYISHNGSAVAAIPPGVESGGYFGEQLLES